MFCLLSGEWGGLLLAVQQEPWLYVGPPILSITVIVLFYISCNRLIDDDSWAIRTRFPVPSNASLLSFKRETPSSSLILSQNLFIKYHNWRFISSFSSEKFSVDVLLNCLRVAMAGWDNYEKGDIEFVIAENDTVKESVHRLFEENTDMSTDAPFVIGISISPQIGKESGGMILGMLISALHASGIWVHLRFVTNDLQESISSLLEQDNISILLSCGYPANQTILARHNPPNVNHFTKII